MLALGNFDGVHRGHALIIERVRQRAAERGTTAALLTFDPHPPRIVRPDKAPPLLMTAEQKLSFVETCGVDGFCTLDTDDYTEPHCSYSCETEDCPSGYLCNDEVGSGFGQWCTRE